MTQPLVVFDFETSGLDMWSADFRVVSCAFLIYGPDGDLMHELFVQGQDEVKTTLEKILEESPTFLVYNASFEWSVCKAALGLALPLTDTIDVMRLVQLWGCAHDGRGWGLQAATERILGIKGYKQKYYSWLRENVPESKNKPGAYLSQLPPELLREYNLADCYHTKSLYDRISSKFDTQDYDWRPDHSLYRLLVQWVSESRIQGIAVDRQVLLDYLPQIDAEVAAIDAKFRSAVGKEIEAVRLDLHKKAQARFKKKIVTAIPEFNIQSRAHLEALFCGKLGRRARILTPTGKPSFKSSHLSQWGEIGSILEKRGKRLKVKEHVVKLLEASESDERWHADIKLCGTISGRLAGGTS
jgi:DNA polymerase I-like protein with 3'-5' exonuclease and polymerase domains